VSSHLCSTADQVVVSDRSQINSLSHRNDVVP
jgi:hypothetical protein